MEKPIVDDKKAEEYKQPAKPVTLLKEESEEVKKELLSKSELSIWLDRYEDIFSDFDSRPMQHRSLSDDFLSEARKMAREKHSGKIELKLLMPENLRHKETETIIIKSLHSHFRQAATMIEEEKKQMERKGIRWSVTGILLMMLASYIANLQEKNFIVNTVLIILEPAGWFTLWSGLDFIFSRSNQRKADFDFNNKMSHAEIGFLSF